MWEVQKQMPYKKNNDMTQLGLLCLFAFFWWWVHGDGKKKKKKKEAFITLQAS